LSPSFRTSNSERFMRRSSSAHLSVITPQLRRSLVPV
jgi:hypothetical protein